MKVLKQGYYLHMYKLWQSGNAFPLAWLFTQRKLRQLRQGKELMAFESYLKINCFFINEVDFIADKTFIRSYFFPKITLEIESI